MSHALWEHFLKSYGEEQEQEQEKETLKTKKAPLREGPNSFENSPGGQVHACAIMY